jgi:Hemerythrin HHE cation binding domain
VTSLSLQDTSALGGPVSVLTRQKRDHVLLDELLHQLRSDATSAREEAVLNRIARLVFPHAFAEESVLWPEIRRVLPDGQALTLQVEQEHQEVNELWRRLETLPFGGPERRAVLDRLATVLRDDVRDEEDALLPELQERVSPGRLRTLGLAWEAVRRISPTRPHPVVSRRPPGNVMAAVPLTLLDRSRDRLDQLGRTSTRASAPAKALSSRLARLADRVEKVPLISVRRFASSRWPVPRPSSVPA